MCGLALKPGQTQPPDSLRPALCLGKTSMDSEGREGREGGGEETICGRVVQTASSVHVQTEHVSPAAAAVFACSLWPRACNHGGAAAAGSCKVLWTWCFFCVACGSLHTTY